MSKRFVKIKIPAQTVTVDVDGWSLEYGVELKNVREDVKGYFRTWCQEQVDALGLGGEQQMTKKIEAEYEVKPTGDSWSVYIHATLYGDDGTIEKNSHRVSRLYVTAEQAKDDAETTCYAMRRMATNPTLKARSSPWA